MFKQLVNECTIEMRLRPEGALLIKSGMPQMTDVDMSWVRVYRNGQPEVFLPGSSLKGMIRSHAERIARTLKDNCACDPFSKHGDTIFCGNFLETLKRNNRGGEISTPEVYKKSCPTCRLFGNTFILGRFATEDAYIEGESPKIQHRDGIGIDRFTGGASRGAKFELEVITGGVFKTTLHLQNFELWQLGLLGFVLQDMRDGLVRMGSGKSRGLGKITADFKIIKLDYLGSKGKIIEDDQINIMGVGALFQQADQYGMEKNDCVSINKSLTKIPNSPFSELRQSMEFSFDTFPWQQVAERWVKYAQNYKREAGGGGSYDRKA